MADDREEIAEAARTITEAAAESVNVEAAAEAAIEAAEERMEAAEAVAEALADAALRDKLGQQISDLRAETEQWRATLQSEMTSLSTQHASLSEQVASLTTLLAEAKASQNPAPVTVAEIPISSIPQELAAEIQGQVANPLEASAAPAAPVVLAVPRERRGRWT